MFDVAAGSGTALLAGGASEWDRFAVCAAEEATPYRSEDPAADRDAPAADSAAATGAAGAAAGPGAASIAHGTGAAGPAAAGGGAGVADDAEESEPSVGAVMSAALDRLATTPGSPAAAALARIAEGITALTEVDFDDEHIEVLGDVLLGLQRCRSDLDDRLLAALASFDDRDGAAPDGASSTAVWLAHRSNLPVGRARSLTAAARRLPDLPLFAADLTAGDIAVDHLLAVTARMVDGRAAAITANEASLAAIARAHAPAHVALAIRRIAETIDPDGSSPDADAPPPTVEQPVGRHPDRALHHARSFDGLGFLDATLDPLTRELLTNALDACTTPDPADTPIELRRSAAQIRHDAFHTLLTTVTASTTLPTVHGARPNINITIGLAELLGLPPNDPRLPVLLTAIAIATGTTLPGLTDQPTTPSAESVEGGDRTGDRDDDRDGHDGDGDGDGDAVPEDGAITTGDAATRASTAPSTGPAVEGTGTRTGLSRPARYASGTPIPAAHVRDLLLSDTGATIRAVLTLGPWKPVNVGAAHRTLPPWLRTILHALHQRCRGPGCDRPFTWTQAAHQTIPWRHAHTTDLNTTLPLCGHCHRLHDLHGWTVTVDSTTGTATWTSPQGRTVLNHPLRA